MLATRLTQALRCPVHIGSFDSEQQIIPALNQPLLALDLAMIEWSKRHQHMAGQFTDTFKRQPMDRLAFIVARQDSCFGVVAISNESTGT